MTSISTLIFFLIAKQSKKRVADAEDRAQAQLHVLVQREIARQRARQAGRMELAKMHHFMDISQHHFVDHSHE